MARYLLDTSALLTHYRQEAGWEIVQNLFENIETEVEIASPTLVEFARRLHSLGAEDDTIQQVVDSYTLLFTEIINIDRPVSMIAYSIGRQTPDRLPLIDALIAAAAQMNEAVLVHRDMHMAAIPANHVSQLLLI